LQLDQNKYQTPPYQPPPPQNQEYIRPPEYVQTPAQIQYSRPPAVQPGYETGQEKALADQYKKTAEQYYSEFNQNSQIMTDSLKKIENIVVDVLKDQVCSKQLLHFINHILCVLLITAIR
jgi:uncharacterized protein YcbK (DUF882 family)